MSRPLVVALIAMQILLVSPGGGAPAFAQSRQCANFPDRAAAQAALEADPASTAALDADQDGLACEDAFDPEAGDGAIDAAQGDASPRPDVDCQDLVYQELAQQVLERNPADPFDLDTDGDGIACSSLPAMTLDAARLPSDPVVAANAAAEVATTPDQAPREASEPLPPVATEVQPPARPAQAASSASAAPTGSRLKAGLLAASEDVDQFWQVAYLQLGGTYTSPETRLFQQVLKTGCGPAETGLGPAYCPLDQTIYIDMPVVKEIAIFQDPFVMRMIFAHEWAHHVQFLSGYEAAIFPARPGEVLGLQLELHADCLAGVWARSALEAGEATEDDLLDAMALAYVMGDAPETPFLAPDAHGTGDMRLGAFVMGLEDGKPKTCEREILELL